MKLERGNRWKGRLSASAFRVVCVLSVLALSSASWAEESLVSPSDGAERRISASELERLLAISTRLASLNERLRTELETSRLNSAGLETSLESSTRELATLKLELERSRLASNELAQRAESSERESIALSEALRKADASLRSLELSFAEYRKAAELRMSVLSFGALGAGILAAAGWAVAIIALVSR
ncbi:MAG TPA: hypothetical protein VMV44_02590 [Rectinemataceae bacterium]|nr:hypothetical protein [Rectinemataceae bacterium]